MNRHTVAGRRAEPDQCDRCAGRRRANRKFGVATDAEKPTSSVEAETTRPTIDDQIEPSPIAVSPTEVRARSPQPPSWPSAGL